VLVSKVENCAKKFPAGFGFGDGGSDEPDVPGLGGSSGVTERTLNLKNIKVVKHCIL